MCTCAWTSLICILKFQTCQTIKHKAETITSHGSLVPNAKTWKSNKILWIRLMHRHLRKNAGNGMKLWDNHPKWCELVYWFPNFNILALFSFVHLWPYRKVDKFQIKMLSENRLKKLKPCTTGGKFSNREQKEV